MSASARAAIGGFDDVHAWLVRGFVEAGLPDHTPNSGSGRGFRADGALNLENLGSDRFASGILLEFLCVAGDIPIPEDEYTYAVYVVREPAGTKVVVRSADVLFHHTFDAMRPEGLAAQILGVLKQHNDAFTAWRGAGNEPSPSERHAIPEVRGQACERGLAILLDRLARERTPIDAGPAEGWWTREASPQAIGQAITAGKGREPQYRIGPKASGMNDPANVAYVQRVRLVGLALIVSGALAMVLVCAGLSETGWGILHTGIRALLVRGWESAGILANLTFAGMQIVAGWRLRVVRSRTLAMVLAGVGMLPCFAPCCVTGLPLGIWTILVLRDPRAPRVFAAPDAPGIDANS